MTSPLADRSIDADLERAIVFLVEAMTTRGVNPKPLILHSMRVALHLYDAGYPREVVLAATLHDVLEDSHTSPETIGETFGDDVLRLVQAVSFDPSITDRAARTRELLERGVDAGRDALLIRAADYLDNSLGYRPDVDPALFQQQLGELHAFVAASTNPLSGSLLWQDVAWRAEQLRVGDTAFRVAPTLAASALIFDAAGRVLLVRENYGRRRYNLPGGRVEPGQSPAQTVVREVREETGLEVRVEHLVGMYHFDHRRPFIGFMFRCSIICGEPTVQSDGEIAEVGWFDPSALPEPMPQSTPLAIRDALNGERGISRDA